MNFVRFRPLVCLILAWFTLCVAGYLLDIRAFWRDAVGLSQKIWLISNNLNLVTYTLACIYGLYLYRNWGELFSPKGNFAIVIISTILAIATLIMSMITSTLGSPTLTGISPLTFSYVIISLSVLVVLTFFFYSIVLLLFKFLDSVVHFSNKKVDKLFVEGFSKKSFFIYFLILVFCWLPYVLAFLPGTSSPDMSSQINQYNTNVFVDSNPLLSTIINGFVFSVGNFLGGEGDIEAGILALAILQSLSLAFAFSYQISVIYRTGAPRFLMYSFIAFFAFSPIFGLFCQWAVKDVIFSASFVIFIIDFILIILIMRQSGLLHRRLLLSLVVSGIAVGLLRHNGCYAVVPSLVFLVIFCSGKSNRMVIAVSAITIAICVPLINSTLAFALNARHASFAGVPAIVTLQQTARYVTKHPDDIQPWEREILEKAFDFDKIEERYRWEVADPLFGIFHDEYFSDYIKVWASFGMRHPETYIEAAILQTSGYWTVGTTRPAYEELVMLSRAPNDGLEYGKWLPESVATKASSVIGALLSLPLFGVVNQAGFYTWLLLLEASYLLWKKQWKGIVLLLPCFLLLLTVMAGPLNGSMRYVLGIACTAPITLWGTLLYASAKGLD